MRQRNKTKRRTNTEVCHAVLQARRYRVHEESFKRLTLFHRRTIEYQRHPSHPRPARTHARAREAIQEMGCITSRPLATRRPKTAVTPISPLNIKETSRRLAHLRAFCSRLLRSCIPHRPISGKTADAPSTSPEPGGNILWGEQIDRYEEAMAEMSLPKGERLRKQSAPESCRSGGSTRTNAVDRDDGESVLFSRDSFLF